MKKEDYIKAIEELNEEQVKFYNSPEFKLYKYKKIKRDLWKSKQYGALWDFNMKNLRKSFDKKRKKIVSFFKKFVKKTKKFIKKIFKKLKKKIKRILKKIKKKIKKILKKIKRVIKKIFKLLLKPIKRSILKIIFVLIRKYNLKKTKKWILQYLSKRRKKYRLKKEKIEAENALKEKIKLEKIEAENVLKEKIELEKIDKQNELNLAKNETNKADEKEKIDTSKIKKLDLSNKKIAVYTCVTGAYDNIYSPLITTDNTDYFIFSDNQQITDNTKYWKLRNIPEYIKEICSNDNILINRYIKMHPKELFPNYDYALYVDGNIRIISDIADLFNIINDKTGIAIHTHRMRKDVYEEARACIKVKKGKKKNIIAQMEKYEKEGLPKNFGLFEANVLALDLNNENSVKIFNSWWDEFYKSGTYRDQLILPYILWKNDYKFDDVGVLGNYMDFNPKFRRNNHINYK